MRVPRPNYNSHREQILKRKNFLPTLLVTILLWILLGALVYFVDPETLKPFENQWDFLESINRVEEVTLDEIIEINALSRQNQTEIKNTKKYNCLG